jgi:arylsulfatase A-like enzyme
MNNRFNFKDRMRRRSIFCPMAFTIAFLISPIIAQARPNIVFLFADDQRPDTIAAHGNPHIQTPNLDRLVAEGFSFRTNYCAGSYSGAVCVASRSMLMTGRHWTRIRDRRNWRDMPLLPEILGKNGYETFAVGKWHNGLKTLARAFQSGRNLYMGGMCDHTKVPFQHLGKDGKLTAKETGSTFSSALFADAATDFIQSEHPKDKPFFLYVAFTAPHDPRNPPENYREMYYRNRPPLPKNFLPLHPFDNGNVAGNGRDESLSGWPRDPKVISEQLCEYYGLITHLDEQVGRVTEALKNSPHADNTILIYTADHGLGMGSHGLLGKQNIYEHSMGSPLIVSGPNVQKGKSTKAMTYLLDLYPTICNLTDTKIPEGTNGHDLAPVWSGKKEKVRDSVFLAFQDKMRSVRDDRWKLHIYPKINHTLLFDLKNDPNEINNLSEDPQHKPHIVRLTALMNEWQQKVEDRQVLSSEKPAPKTFDPTGKKRVLDVWQPKWTRDKYFDGRNDPNHGPRKKKK